MDPERLNQRLSQISTSWTTLLQAHEGPSEAAGDAQRRLLQCYAAAIYRYLLGGLRDEDAADEAFQEFALRFVRGDLRRADPDRGRFRDFLKTTLYHLIIDTRRRRQRSLATRSLSPEVPEPSGPPSPLEIEDDRRFLEIWRSELLGRAWAALEDYEQRTGQVLYTVLRFRTDHPEARSPQMAEQLAERLGRPLTAEWVRKRLFLAREKFTDLLLEDVARTLKHPTAEELEEELRDLGLLDYCRPALGRWSDP